MINCCGESKNLVAHPDYTKEIHRLNRISGQIDGIKRMISEREYCPKIITQIQAARAALKSLESVVLEIHLASCVQGALNSKDKKEAELKTAELLELFRRN
ncbi:MAG: hypothetical protein DCC75_10235 [Proteobacteria bacterium]|nr:MAG: hypothetical protein DCC75_10235 [Pseudomonadota bacterium]